MLLVVMLLESTTVKGPLQRVAAALRPFVDHPLSVKSQNTSRKIIRQIYFNPLDLSMKYKEYYSKGTLENLNWYILASCFYPSI